jgi:hypothetical protein
MSEDYANARGMRNRQDAKPGFTPVEATAFLQEEFPDVPHWTYIHLSHHPANPAMARIAGYGYAESGQVGSWKWERVESRYPRLAFWGGELKARGGGGVWTGVLRIHSPDGKAFLLFSYLSHRDEFCHQYLASTDDRELLRQFVSAVTRHFRRRRRNKAVITVMNGPDIELDCGNTVETIFLPSRMQDDIDTQVDAFFTGRPIFEKLGARYQRGFLFVGPPGTGKTMMMRRIIRNCHRKYKARFVSLTIGKKLDEDDLGMAFSLAESQGPSILLLEDMDSLTHETMVSRSAFLALLDGLKANKGILILASSNNPDQIDPALLQRPSRFDRVWTFPVPDLFLRRRYLAHHFGSLPADMVESVAARTGDWSYAYLNELRTTAAILAVGQGAAGVTVDILDQSTTILASQFNSGKKNHVASSSENGVGFKVA